MSMTTTLPDPVTAASAAGEGCPVSKALKGNVDIKVDAKLKS